MKKKKIIQQTDVNFNALRECVFCYRKCYWYTGFWILIIAASTWLKVKITFLFYSGTPWILNSDRRQDWNQIIVFFLFEKERYNFAHNFPIFFVHKPMNRAYKLIIIVRLDGIYPILEELCVLVKEECRFNCL